jgi:putative SOS response-associated peptidase YedK
MCGRYNITTNVKALLDAFDIIQSDSALDSTLPHYNISPSHKQLKYQTFSPIVRNISGQRHLDGLLWPFIPQWAKGDAIKVMSKYNTINAKCENLKTSNSYRNAWKNQQRCLIPATGFYEWQVIEVGKPKQPYHITITDQQFFAMAGIWEISISIDKGYSVASFAIITTQANELMADIHNTQKRMPVILKPEQYDSWLTGNEEEAMACLKQYPSKHMMASKIGRMVNIPNNNDERCIAALN